jgi:hypothetical protein
MDVKSGPDLGTAQKREKAADSGKQFTIQDSVDFQPSQPENDADAVREKTPERTIIQGKDVLVWNPIENTRKIPVPFEQQQVDFGAPIPLPDEVEHGFCKHEASHLGKDDDQDLTWNTRRMSPLVPPGEQGQNSAERNTDNPIQNSLRR